MVGRILVSFWCAFGLFFLSANAEEASYYEKFLMNHYTVFVNASGTSCSGAVIGAKHVLTAAHCLVDRNTNKILNQTVEISKTNGQVFKVKKICVPNKYQSHHKLGFGYGDIAVLELDSTFSDKNTMDEIKLTLAPAGPLSNYYYKKGKLSAFGATKIFDNGTRSSPGELTYAFMKIFDKTTCENVWPNIAKYIDHERLLCAQVQLPVTGVCDGDDGGPLVYEVDGVNYLVGLLSFGPDDCNEINSSGIYTKISYYKNFISNVMNGFNDVNAKCLNL